jgi:hypothetical protein
LASTAVVIDTAMIEPLWRNMPRRPAIDAIWSGASCRPALFDAGTAMPIPIPVTAAVIDSHR